MSAFREDASFGDLRGGFIRRPDGSGGAIPDRKVPSLLVTCVIEGNCVDDLVEEMRDFAQKKTSVVHRYMLLAGASIEKTACLSDDVDLISWDDIPVSREKYVFRVYPIYPMDSTPPMTGRVVHILPANRLYSAIRIRLPDWQVLFSRDEEYEKARRAIYDEEEERKASGILRDTASLATVLGGYPLTYLGTWCQIDNRIASKLGGLQVRWNHNELDGLWKIRRPASLDGEVVSKMYRAFESFEPSEKDAMRISMSRFKGALSKANIVDRAIDLGIALEVILLHGIDSRDRGELRYRTSIRGTAFLGGNKEKRLATFLTLRKAYDLRSKAVHSGTSKIKDSKEDEDVLGRSITTYAELVRKVIEHGSFPDWDKEYVIGGK